MLLTFYKETFSEKQDKKAFFRFGSAVIGVYKIIVAQINVSVNTVLSTTSLKHSSSSNKLN